MRPAVKKRLLFAAAASSGLLGLIGYPAVKSVYPIKKQITVIDDYVDIPTATADLTKDITMPEGVGAGTDVPIDVSHWLLLSMLKSRSWARRERALNELASQRRWNDAECQEIAQALNKQEIIKLARTVDADLRLFLPPPSIEFIERSLNSDRIEKLVKTILKNVFKSDLCSSCANFYTSLSIRVRPDSNILAMSDLNQVDKMLRVESRKRKRSIYNEDVIKLKAVLNNVICGEEQALTMAKSGLLLALLYFHHKYKHDVQVNSLLSQILASLSLNQSTRDFLFVDGWIRTLVEYSRSDHLEICLPAFKALANLDNDARKTYGVYGNHLYLLHPVYHEQVADFDVIFLHGLVGTVFKSWRQGQVKLDSKNNEENNQVLPTTELLQSETFADTENSANGDIEQKLSKCWPKDWLPQDVPGLRILAVDYPTALSGWRTDCDLNKDTLRERAQHVMKQLELAKLGERPIVWVAHSMGGLLVKQIMVLCDEHVERQNAKKAAESTLNGIQKVSKRVPQKSMYFEEKLLKQTKGVVFYSVPHKGSNLDWIERKNLQKLLMLTTEVVELQKGSPILTELHEKFLTLVNKQKHNISFLSYAENSSSSFGVNKVVQWRGILVHQDSLQFELGKCYKLEIDHAHTCKPSHKDALTYVKTLELIKDLMPSRTKEQENEHERLLPFISFIL